MTHFSCFKQSKTQSLTVLEQQTNTMTEIFTKQRMNFSQRPFYKTETKMSKFTRQK